MKTARDAVISYALTYTASGVDKPGRFPCGEDTSVIGGTTEGQQTSSCSTSYIPKRLAWKSLNLGDLRDGNKDKLWYALSPAFNKSASVINSDTTPTLGMNGTANSAIAVIFSPGNPLSGQTRTSPTSSNPPNVSDYLEGDNSNGDVNFVTATATTGFNDQLITIEPDDVFPLLEKRVLREIKNYLTTYKSQWGAYPFPATFSNPTTASYVGSAGNTGGLLPVGDPGATYSGATVSPAANGSCVNSGTSLQCTLFNFSPVAVVTTINATLSNLAFGFYQPLDVTNTS
ncbi:MAG TPA: hypothetical protein VFS17_01670, partial [Methylophilaceae bacterium]|nr:hypothetical protein [Methylophilaceae bacterium]